MRAERQNRDAERFRRYRALLAPGTPLRDGLDRIVHGRTGALVVLGDNKVLDQVSTGGFTVTTDFTPTALRELAKLDGGIVVTEDLSRILRAGVHFVPDGAIPTIETGTRHRTADRLSQQAHLPVVTVSASMGTIALFLDGLRYPIEPSSQIMVLADQALATLARYRDRLEDETRSLTAAEIDDAVTVRIFVDVAQRVEMVRRLAEELESYVEALGVDGRLLQLQLYELTAGVDQIGTLLEADYRPANVSRFALDELRRLSTGDLLDSATLVTTIGFPSGTGLDDRLHPRGYRLMGEAAQLPSNLTARLLDHFGSLQALFTASVSDLMQVDGVGDARARAIRDGLAKVEAGHL